MFGGNKGQSEALRQLVGFAGYIGVGKNMVFLEGEDSSVDRKIFSEFFAKYSGKIKLILVKHAPLELENIARY
jgi:hypothetical protein